MTTLAPAPVGIQFQGSTQELFARATGEGPETVVFLHAIGIDGRSWEAVAGWMPDELRCVAVDQQGFGASASNPPESFAAHAADVIALLDELGVERAHLVGHSYGGAVAATLALSHPERVASLSLVASVITAPSAMFEERAASAEAGGVESYADATIGRWFTEEELDCPGRPIGYVGEVLRQTPVGSWATGWRILGGYDLAPRLAEITVPTAIVAGEFDASIPMAQLEAAAGQMPNASLGIIRGGAHMLPIERPYELARVLYSHIRRNHVS